QIHYIFLDLQTVGCVCCFRPTRGCTLQPVPTRCFRPICRRTLQYVPICMYNSIDKAVARKLLNSTRHEFSCLLPTSDHTVYIRNHSSRFHLHVDEEIAVQGRVVGSQAH
ncbi:unnamed protein product, partial [Ectocarpus sp. 4 AP-2014]